MAQLVDPPVDFPSVELALHALPAGPWWRLYRAPYTNPLDFGYRPSRFSDPRVALPQAERYGVLYLGSSIEVCFLETMLRDARNGLLGDLPIPYAELEQWQCAQVTAGPGFTAVDLRGGGAVALGVPTDAIRGSAHAQGQRWSLAFWSHPRQPDGLLYPSRFNEQTNLVVFDRAFQKLRVKIATALLSSRDEMTKIVRKYKLTII
jgi:hypothetical protein